MNEGKVFQCSLCPFYAAYDRYDSSFIDNTAPAPATTTTTTSNRKKVADKLEIELMEKVYLIRDPFVAVKEQDVNKIPPLIIGGTCSVCSCPVCVNIDCSIFFTRRFCLRCVSTYREEFPKEVLDEIGTKRLDKFPRDEAEYGNM